ncbi:CCCH zinc finger protein [Aspergillus tanneri]|uniref:C3H1-type domain-containing protein n=1 Tax=Aspergillus tanneri TaxID=1220188 RepID=A0A5M9MMI5_9EURO|nr:uncharacterized protein ATNIH1004_004115 [Aspergillus tanneri]KAA8648232.1 hypothetical protein ATNIH1004_004115 [Aspergillus tanneri]
MTRGYFDQYSQLSSIDQRKNVLIEELLQRVSELEEAYQREKLDHDRETRFNRDIQIHEMELMDQITRMKNVMVGLSYYLCPTQATDFRLALQDREPFIVALLDGAGMIFKDEFLQQGEQGGLNAAAKLHSALYDYVAGNFPGIKSPKIITKILVNVKGLGELCVRGGVTTELSLIEDFVRGFNTSFPLFEMLDIGTGKGSAHDKIAEAFKLNLYNCHCHQIFLGCSQDSAYARMLEDILRDTDLRGRVSLIEGLPFETGLDSIKASYRVTRFSDLFRNTNITVWAPWKAAVASKPRSLLTSSPVPQSVSLSRTSTNTSSTSDSVPFSATCTSAASSTSGEFQIVRTRSSPKTPTPKIVERNKYGQRVDRIDFRDLPREEVTRLKKLKLCNYHFLQGECPNGSCSHDHSRKLTKSELHILKAIARMTPCRYGLDCDDPECIYGHRCPQSEPGRTGCYWGSNCRFSRAAHGVDINIVKVTKV